MTETLTFDKLRAGSEVPTVTESATLLSGETRTRGTLLGKITLGTATVAAKAGGNTGGGTCTKDATTPVLTNAQLGVYTITCITAVENGGIFRVVDPKGNVLGDVAVAATFANQIKFAIADGTPDFAVGDGFTFTIAAGSGKFKLCNSANLDGSQYPYGVLAVDCDASGGDKTCVVYLTGEFNTTVMTFGGSDTAATHKAACRELAIFFKTNIAA